MKITKNEKKEIILKEGQMACIRQQEAGGDSIHIHGDNENEIKLIVEMTTFDDEDTRGFIRLFINGLYITWFAGYVLDEVYCR